WSIANLTQIAHDESVVSSDFSLVALAALSNVPVVLTALRESSVLYAAAIGAGITREEPHYVWEVDEVLRARAERFVRTFNDLFDESLPMPTPENAQYFWAACSEWKIVGRCVRIGFDDSVDPVKHYHWAIDQDAGYKLVVKEFWDTEIWTTNRYRQAFEARL